MHTLSHIIFQLTVYIFSADMTPKMLELCRVAKVKVFLFEYVFNFDLFEVLAASLF